MKKTFAIGAPLFLALAAVDLSGQSGATGYPSRIELRWRSGIESYEAQTASQVVDALRGLAARSEADQVVVAFDRALTRPERESLTSRGVELQQYLGAHAFVARLSRDADIAALGRLDLLRFAGPIRPENRLHPFYTDGVERNWAQTAVGAATGLEVATILFAREVSESRIHEILDGQGATVLGRVPSLDAFTVELPTPGIFALADHDEVLWIEPPLPRMRAGNYQAALDAEVDEVRVDGPPNVPGNAYQLDGAGVTVMVYDVGQADTTHPALFPRATNNDASGTDPFSPSHPTHVSATIAGSGAGTPPFGVFLEHAGMAPACTIENYGFLTNGTFNNGDLYSNPQDLEQDFTHAINVRGAVLSNCSMWSAPSLLNPVQCGWLGDYGVTAALIDQIVIGATAQITTPFRSVWITGNDRGSFWSGCSTSYGTIGPPGTAKNCITVGALDDNFPLTALYSGWGPVDDGRLKPDVVAVGDSLMSAASSLANPGTGYAEFSGTSQAAPVVTGTLALLLQDFRVQYPNWGTPAQAGDPYNCSLKTWLTHSARDLGNYGPDFVYGWGGVDIRAAIDLMRSGAWDEGQLAGGSGDVRAYLVQVTDSSVPLQVTLAWDDADASPIAAQQLVDDLDLVVVDPNGVRHYPWTLFPWTPTNWAINTSPFPDTTNNVEQVQVDSPMLGSWLVQVVLSNNASGEPRAFGVAADPGLPKDCNGNGILDHDELAAGTALDCNANGLPDECDLASGISHDCNANGLPDECDIDVGVSNDCNENGIPDECDLADGTSDDCDGNGVPDECDPDCDGDGTPDVCAISSGLSPDCNGNGVPDECDIGSGSSADCNSNSIPDECDITSGFSLDCNGNGIPDPCDLGSGWSADCNSNLVPDECDIASGTSTDLNANGVPDECIDEGDCNGNGTSDILDIQTGYSTDCNEDWIPDECQTFPDCNANGQPDACDIYFGTSLDDDGNGVPDECQSVLQAPSAQYPTIQDAIDAAVDGDTVEILDGVHTGPGNVGLSLGEKNLRLVSQNGPNACILDCQGNGRAISASNCQGPYTLIEGITVRNGSANSGGGIYLQSYCGPPSKAPIVRNCVIEYCSASGSGGGVFADDGGRFESCTFRSNSVPGGVGGGGGILSNGDTVIEGCTFVGNSAPQGGGVHMSGWGTNSSIDGSTFDGNQGGSYGGGVYLSSAVDAVFVVKNCVVRNNTAANGAGIYVGGTVNNEVLTTIESCRILDNQASSTGGGVYAFDPLAVRYCHIEDNHAGYRGGGVSMSRGEIRNSLIANNAAGSYGGGVYSNDHPPSAVGLEMRGTTVANNTSDDYGGGLRLVRGVLENCIFWGNATLSTVGQQISAGADLTIRYCDVAGGLAGIDGGVTTWGPGNKDTDPVFVDAAAGDFHLRGSSPCKNAGDPAFAPQQGETDFEGDPRVIFGLTDMGADEVRNSHVVVP